MLGQNQQRILYNYIGRGCAKYRQWRTDQLFAMPKAEANWQDKFAAVFVGKTPTFQFALLDSMPSVNNPSSGPAEMLNKLAVSYWEIFDF